VEFDIFSVVDATVDDFFQLSRLQLPGITYQQTLSTLNRYGHKK